MIRASGRLAAMLVVGLGVAAAFEAATSAGQAEPDALSARHSRRTEDAETSTQRRAVAEIGRAHV